MILIGMVKWHGTMSCHTSTRLELKLHAMDQHYERLVHAKAYELKHIMVHTYIPRQCQAVVGLWHQHAPTRH